MSKCKRQLIRVEGISGYHLAVDAGNDAAVQRLRQRKLRDEKPFAVMSFDLQRVKQYAQVSALDERLLSGVERPIALLPRRVESPLSA